MNAAKCALIFVFVAAAFCGARAQPALESKTYDVSDLIATARPDDQPDPTAAPLPPDAPIGTRSRTRTEARRELIKIIKDTVDPTSWEPNHVPPAMITFASNTLVIVQSSENQRGVANLLSQLRGDGSEMLQAAIDTTRLPRTKFDKAPLAQAVHAVANAAQVSVEVDWGSFGRIPLAAETPVSIDLPDATAARAIRALFDTAAGHSMPLRIDATPKLIRIALDPPSGQGFITRVYNLRAMPARACGLDPKRPFTRTQALTALVARIKDDAHQQRLREVDGMIIVTAPLDGHHRIASFLDQLDAQAIRERDSKP